MGIQETAQEDVCLICCTAHDISTSAEHSTAGEHQQSRRLKDVESASRPMQTRWYMFVLPALLGRRQKDQKFKSLSLAT